MYPLNGQYCILFVMSNITTFPIINILLGFLGKLANLKVVSSYRQHFCILVQMFRRHVTGLLLMQYGLFLMAYSYLIAHEFRIFDLVLVETSLIRCSVDS
jgi:hypothetical protein